MVSPNSRAGIPYGYAPYPTWQKKVPTLVLPLVRPAPVLEDPFAATAFWGGVASILLTLTGCGAPLGLALAPFSIRAAIRSGAWGRRFGMPCQPKASIGAVMSLGSILLALTMLAAMLVSTGHRHTVCHGDPRTGPAPTVTVTPEYRYQPSDAAQRELNERMKRYQADQKAWEAEAQRLGLRYPVEPKRTPVKPQNDFQQQQHDYSEGVRQQRQASGK